jgi:hypothetical protein
LRSLESFKTRAREKLLYDLARRLKIEDVYKTVNKSCFSALKGDFRTVSFVFWKYKLTELFNGPANPDFGPLNYSLNLYFQNTNDTVLKSPFNALKQRIRANFYRPFCKSHYVSASGHFRRNLEYFFAGAGLKDPSRALRREYMYQQ